VIVLMNRQAMEFPAPAVAQNILDRFAGEPTSSMTAPSPPTDAPPLMPGCPGWYLGPAGLLEIYERSGGLGCRMAGEDVRLIAVRPAVYVSSEERVSIEVGFVAEASPPVRFAVVNRNVCERIDPPAPVTPEPERWRSYEGTYGGHGQVVNVTIEGAELRLQIGGMPSPLRCVAVDGTRFSSLFGLVEFPEVPPGAPRCMRIADTTTLIRISH
jgi:hypothetical protein